MQIASLKTVVAIFVAGFLILPFAKQVQAQESLKPQLSVSEPRMKEAKNPEEGKEIENEAVSKMQGALTKEGLTEESYGQIFEIARADEDLRQKLINFINEERRKS